MRGAESVFALRTAEIGNLSEIVVSHDNAGFSPSWFLEWIERHGYRYSTATPTVQSVRRATHDTLQQLVGYTCPVVH